MKFIEKFIYISIITVCTSCIKQINLYDGNNDNGITLNIDCPKFLFEHTEHFVDLYEKDPLNESNKDDALYFVSILKNHQKN